MTQVLQQRSRAPHRWTPDELRRGLGLASKRKVTKRQQRTLAAAMRAYLLLEGKPENRVRFEWLLEPKPRVEILGALGMLDDERELINWAVRICGVKPRAKDVVAHLRKFRAGELHRAQLKPPTTEELARELAEALDTHLDRHPGLKMMEVAQASLLKTLHVVEDAREELLRGS